MKDQQNLPHGLSPQGLFVVLAATAVALLATPLAAPAMPEIARVFADQALTEPFAQALLSMISFLPGEPSAIFLVKFTLLSVPALFIILGAPIVGKLCDSQGRKSLLIASLVIFGICGTSGYFAESFLELFIGRAALGLSIAGIKTATVAIIGDHYTGAERNRIIGWQGSAMKVGGTLFMLAGGALASMSWQTPFLAYMIAFILLPSAMISLAGSLPDSSNTNSQPKGSLFSLPLGPTTAVFVSAFLASGLFFITPVQLPFYLKNTFSASPFEIGAAIALGNMVGAIISLTYHRFRERIGYVSIYSVTFLSMACGYYIVALAESFTGAVIGMIVAGIGFGLYAPNHSSWILSIVPANQRGLGAGVVTTAMFLGQFSSAILVQPLINKQDPTAVWWSVSMILFSLAAIYALIALTGMLRQTDLQKSSTL